MAKSKPSLKERLVKDLRWLEKVVKERGLDALEVEDDEMAYMFRKLARLVELSTDDLVEEVYRRRGQANDL